MVDGRGARQLVSREPASPSAGRANRFPKRRRLRKRREFLAVQTAGRAAHGRFFLVVAVPAGTAAGRPDPDIAGRIGITVSKKVGSAVKRNRVKRLVREYVRQRRFAPGRDVVIIAKRSAARAAGFAQVAHDLEGLEDRIR